MEVGEVEELEEESEEDETAHHSQPQAADSSGQPQAANNRTRRRRHTRRITRVCGPQGTTVRDPFVGRDVNRRCVWLNLLQIKEWFETWTNVAVAIEGQPWREVEDVFEECATYEVQLWVVIGVG